MPKENLLPICSMMKADNDVAYFLELASDFFVRTNLLRGVVRRTIHVYGCIEFAVKEVWSCRTRLDQMLAVARRP